MSKIIKIVYENIRLSISNGVKNKIFLSIVFLLSVMIAVLNIYAGKYFWYWRFWWFDLVMHFIGGVTIALILFYFSRIFGLKEKIKTASLILFSTIFVATTWEIMEFIIDDNLFGKNYFFDTTTDIFIALLGASIISLLSDKIKIVNSKDENLSSTFAITDVD